ncbi:DNA cytosine methyltransferase [Campylobacter lari]|uniref:DNA cytosine methyltransferase n=1 Tax=Campylobacter lari TaxID=201 RepID=UPI000E17DAEE|nr:DNA cytosine methyltransferase [Campylobacter lari]EAK0980080.1 DNA cytosine methyltransferase [Campylobacter lari]SUX06702.1 modification methylase [Campylobacter lari]
MALKGLSLFASAGIAEMNLIQCNIEMKLANEILPVRAKMHEFWHPHSKMICGDITQDEIKNQIIETAKKLKIDFILATPPCQGVSLIGKNKNNIDMLKDKRNFLIFEAFSIIDNIKPKVVVIENVARFLDMLFPYKNDYKNIDFIIRDKYSNEYNIDINIYNCADYGIPQNRLRAIIVMTNKMFVYTRPEKHKKIITVKEAIGSLPSLESGETSNIKNHNARKHIEAHILAMKHTPTGRSAFENEVYFPKTKKGERVKGYKASYKRIEWDKPAPTITMRNDCLSSQSNVHPGRLKSDGTYSDARVLTLRELFILSSINADLDIPHFVSDIQIRQMIGEGVPPLLLEKICSNIKENISE